MNEYLDHYTARAAGRTAAALNLFVKQSIRAEAPIVYFFTSRPYLRWIVPIFRLRLNQTPTSRGTAYEIFVWNRCIGRAIFHSRA